ncbi:hypothetical protein LQM14_000703 [Vibrio parahaemolyticus]|uniref:DUF4760 domain-containing protein n=1 Tax=Vibrio parahaemolyticus TaxID=670 RepID=UPI00111FBFEE|nr:hypothetical protein [Vibrio parahaemolyticus]EIO4601473.1 hypothetical protein [Vibrio parahaemolyticus]EJG1857897.1 hypothetical protein [Vibrio parahaemolyticus]EJS4013927.1 hypothetical protein [Vibrio parahaemolyticus]TOP57117.1 hypothetical protein CGH12_19380 [Vibrio parahaemolyticus]HCE2795286.1 hypothetical protein [Vibrio parahaemolyticus]
MASEPLSATDLATITAAGIACITFVVSTATYIKTTRRERRVKTLDYWESIQPSLIAARKDLSSIHDGEWTREIAQTHLNSPNSELISRGLNSFERLGTGVSLDIYDLKVLNKLAGKMIIDSFIAYAPLIAAREEQLDRCFLFREFEILYNELSKLRDKEKKASIDAFK